MLLVVYEQPIVQIRQISIDQRVLLNQDAPVSKPFIEALMLDAVFKQELSQSVLVTKLDIGQSLKVVPVGSHLSAL